MRVLKAYLQSEFPLKAQRVRFKQHLMVRKQNAREVNVDQCYLILHFLKKREKNKSPKFQQTQQTSQFCRIRTSKFCDVNSVHKH